MKVTIKAMVGAQFSRQAAYGTYEADLPFFPVVGTELSFTGGLTYKISSAAWFPAENYGLVNCEPIVVPDTDLKHVSGVMQADGFKVM